MSLHGKIAIVTGSTSGIGLGIANALAAEGAAIMLNGMGDAAEIEHIRQDMAARHGVEVHYNGADMAKPGEIAALVGAAASELGGLHILINNASIQKAGNWLELSREDIESQVRADFTLPILLCQQVVPLMKDAGWGRIINIASAHGLVASGQKSAYVAAKHGIVGLTKVAGIELANDGITCNAICPGWVLTPLVQKQIAARAEREGKPADEVEHDLLAEKQPMLVFTTPEQIGALSVFLCSDAASTITGTPLSIDGGWTAG